MNVTYMLGENACLFHADCREALKALPDNCIDSVVTDPPYALVSVVKRFGGPNAAPAISDGATGVYKRASAGFMGKSWDTGEVAFDPSFWAEVLRVLKPGGYVLAMGGTRTYHRLVCAIEDAGFDVRDMVSWLYGTGFPKSKDVSKQLDKAAGAQRESAGPKVYAGGHVQNHGGGKQGYHAWNGIGVHCDTIAATPVAKQWEGWGTALKPSNEPICLARKPLSEDTIAANVLKWGTGAINVDGCRVAASSYDPNHRQSTGGYDNIKGGMFGVGTTTRPENLKVEGRWPANLYHDGSDEVVEMFPTTSPASGRPRKNNVSMGSSGSGIYGKAGSFVGIGHEDKGGSAARFFYSAKASKADRAGSRHPTIKPISLMRYLCRLITPPGGVVLDPFAGSGTTGAAALQEGFKCLMVEREAEYVADICRRLGG